MNSRTSAPISTIRVRATADTRLPADRPVLDDRLLSAEQRARIAWDYLPRQEEELGGEQLAGVDALVHFSPGANRVTARTLAAAPQLRLIAKMGVGLDAVDVEACTRAGVLVTTTPEPIRNAMAAGTMTLLLALAHRLPEKQQIEREGDWSRRLAANGVGLDGSVVGILGLGNIGAEVARFAQQFGARTIAFGRTLTPARAAAAGSEAVPLDELLARSDYLVITCPLTDETRGLLSRERLRAMKPGAQLVNVARGPIVDHEALLEVLEEGHLAGAGLDVTDPEPLPPGHRLRELPNVILAPHAIGYTHRMFEATALSAWSSVLELADGAIPTFAINADR